MAKRKAGSAIDASVRILVLYGPNEMFRQTCYQQLREALEAEHGAIETYRFDSEEATLADVFDELRSYSLLQQYKLVTLDVGEQFMKSHRKALERYAANPVDHATLVLRAAGKWNPGNFDKLVAKVGAVVKCEHLSRSEAAAWLVDRAKSAHDRKLDKDAAEALVERIGSSLMLLDAELGKLAVLVEAKQPITVDMIDEVVGRASDEDAWVVQEAVLRSMIDGDPAGAIEKIHELIDVGNQPKELITYFVADLMRKFCIARSMKSGGKGEFQITAALKIWPRERGKLFIEVFRQLKPGQVGRLFDRIIELDYRAKSGYGEGVRNLECFAAALADDR